jgi:tetratricopeptide (TPR) repeat protein
MFARLRAYGLLLAVLLFVTGVARAQVTSMEGDVKDETGTPLKGAMVKIIRQDMKGNYQVKTDKKGHYYYGGLPLGKYRVSVEVDGKERDSVNNVSTKFGDTTETSFDLREAAKRNQALNQSASSGQLTKEQERGMTAEQKAAVQSAMKQREAAMAKNKALNDAYNAGRDAMTAKNYPTAIEQLSKASEMDATQSVIWITLADAYVADAGTKTGADQQGEYDKGFAAYQKAIELKPDDAAFHNNYALALVKGKKLDEAQAELQKAAALDPADAAKYYYNLGAVLTNAGQADAAAAAFKKAIDTNPSYAEAQYQYAVALSAKATTAADGKIVPPPGMVEALQKYLELAPTGPNVDAAKGLLQTMQGSIQTNYQNPSAPKKGKKK